MGLWSHSKIKLALCFGMCILGAKRRKQVRDAVRRRLGKPSRLTRGRQTPEGVEYKDNGQIPWKDLAFLISTCSSLDKTKAQPP